MAKSDSGSGFEWSTMWSIFRTIPDDLKRAWMFGIHKQLGLVYHLKDAMENYDKDVQDEMLEHAPIEVQQYFGYVTKDVRNAPKPAKRAYNDKYRSQLLDKIRGITA